MNKPTRFCATKQKIFNILLLVPLVLVLISTFSVTFVFFSENLCLSQEKVKDFHSAYPSSDVRYFQLIGVNRENGRCHRGGIHITWASVEGSTFDDCVCGGHIATKPTTAVESDHCDDLVEEFDEVYHVPIIHNPHRDQANWHEHEQALVPQDVCYKSASDIIHWNWGSIDDNSVCNRLIPQSEMIHRTMFDGLHSSQNSKHLSGKENLSQFYLRLFCHYGPHSKNAKVLLELYFNFHSQFLKLPRLLTLQEGKVLSTNKFRQKLVEFPSRQVSAVAREKYLEFISQSEIYNASALPSETKHLLSLIENRRPSADVASQCKIHLVFVYMVTNFDAEEEIKIRLFLSTIKDDCSFLIFHLDKRSLNFDKIRGVIEIFNHERKHKQAMLIKRSESLSCDWADASLVFSELIGWIYAFKSSFPWDFVINMSAADLPVYANAITTKMQDYLYLNLGRSFTFVSPHQDSHSFLWTRSCDDNFNCCDLRWDNKQRKAHYSWRRMGKGFRSGEKHSYSQWHIYHRELVEAILTSGIAIEALLSLQFVNMVDEAYWVYMAQSFLYDFPEALDGTGRQRTTSLTNTQTPGIPRMAVTKVDNEWIRMQRENKTEPVFYMRKVYVRYLCDFVKDIWGFEINCEGDSFDYWLNEHKYLPAETYLL